MLGLQTLTCFPSHQLTTRPQDQRACSEEPRVPVGLHGCLGRVMGCMGIAGGSWSGAPVRRVPARPIRLLDEAVNVQVVEIVSHREMLAQQSKPLPLPAGIPVRDPLRNSRAGTCHPERMLGSSPPRARRRNPLSHLGYQPRPSEHVAAAQSLNRQAAVTRRTT